MPRIERILGVADAAHECGAIEGHAMRGVNLGVGIDERSFGVDDESVEVEDEGAYHASIGRAERRMFKCARRELAGVALCSGLAYKDSV